MGKNDSPCFHVGIWLLDGTHQLELAAASVGCLDARVAPEGTQGGHVQLEGARLHGNARLALKRHHEHAVLLVLRVLPGDAQLVPRVHQHPHALQGRQQRRISSSVPHRHKQAPD